MTFAQVGAVDERRWRAMNQGKDPQGQRDSEHGIEDVADHAVHGLEDVVDVVGHGLGGAVKGVADGIEDASAQTQVRDQDEK